MLECNMFRDIWDKDCTTVVPISSVLKAIREGKWKEQIETIRSLDSKEEISRAKQKLPSVTFSGVFEDTREDKNIVFYNNLMVVDIDTISDKRLITFKKELQQDKYILAFFNGPTKGVKILMQVNTESNEHSTYAFSSVKCYFDEVYNIPIDVSGKNISRLCFVSYDPDLYINENPFVFPVKREIYDDENNNGYTLARTASFDDYVKSTDGKKIFETSTKMVKKSKTGHYRKGNRNNFVFSLACLLSDFGVPIEFSIQMAHERYASLEYKEIKTTIESAYRKMRASFGTREFNVLNRNNNQEGFQF